MIIKFYVNFDSVINAIRNGSEMELNGKTVSFSDVDVVTTCYATLYTTVADMAAHDRQSLTVARSFHIYRAIRSLINDLYNITGVDRSEMWNAPDRYTTVVHDILDLGIAPTPALYNIIMNTGIGMRTEMCFSVGEGAILDLSEKCDDYYKVVNNDFFEEYNAFENMDFAENVKQLAGVQVPDNMFSWLSQYQWNYTECEYVRKHFKAFCNRYEQELIPND